MATRKNQIRMDSATEQLPAKLSNEEEQLLALARKNTKFSRDELVIPRLKILQTNSPEVEERGTQQVAGARAGMFYNTASGKLTPGDTGMIVCIIGGQKQIIEWQPRDIGGGIVKNWGMDDGWKAKCHPDQWSMLTPKTTDGHEIDRQRTFLIFDIDVTTGEYDPSFFNLRSTATQTANQMATLISNAKAKLSNGQVFTPPYYYYLYKLLLDRRTNPKGTWWAPRCIKHAGPDGSQVKLKDIPNGAFIFEQAIQMQEHFMEGDLQQTDWEQPTPNNDDLDADKITF